MTITLRQLEYLTAVAEAGSVTGAASALYVSASTVSNAVSELEKTLDLKLFVRQARGLSLTREGRTVLSQARLLLRGVADLELTAVHMGEDMRGRLRIGCYSSIAAMLIPSIVAEFAADHPGIEVEFAEGARDELLEGLLLGRFDVVVLYDYTFKDDLDGVGDTTHLASIPPYALVPTDHPCVGSGPVRLEDLAPGPLILLGLEPADQYFRSLFDARGLIPHVLHRTKNIEVLRGLVARGVGYSLLTQRMALTTTYEGLEYAKVELAGDVRPLDVVAVAPSSVRMTRRVRTFIDMARQALVEVSTPGNEPRRDGDPVA